MRRGLEHGGRAGRRQTPRSSPPAVAGQAAQTADAKHHARSVRIELAPWTIVALLLVAAGLWLLFRLWPVVLVLVAALVVAGTLSPAVRWLEEKRIGRATGIAIVFTAFFVARRARRRPHDSDSRVAGGRAFWSTSRRCARSSRNVSPALT